MLAGCEPPGLPARELAWAQRIETRGGLPQAAAAGLAVPGLILNLDASIVSCHSEKESVSPTWKIFGYDSVRCEAPPRADARLSAATLGCHGDLVSPAAAGMTVDQALAVVRRVEAVGCRF
jgi:hypothetical protein